MKLTKEIAPLGGRMAKLCAISAWAGRRQNKHGCCMLRRGRNIIYFQNIEAMAILGVRRKPSAYDGVA